jgi:hypothetical protein
MDPEPIINLISYPDPQQTPKFDPLFENLRYLDSEKAENKVFCCIFCPDHGAKISPYLGMCITQIRVGGPIFLTLFLDFIEGSIFQVKNS